MVQVPIDSRAILAHRDEFRKVVQAKVWAAVMPKWLLPAVMIGSALFCGMGTRRRQSLGAGA